MPGKTDKKRVKDEDNRGTSKGEASTKSGRGKEDDRPASEGGDRKDNGGGLPSTQPTGSPSPASLEDGERRLTAEEFQGLSDVPPEAEWFNNIQNPRTRRAYKIDVHEFMRFIGITTPGEFRQVTRSHVIAWRKDLEARKLEASSIRRKLSALSSLFDHLCESNSVLHNPVLGVKRPLADANEGKTPAIGDAQAVQLLEAPREDTIKGKRDRAILAVFLFHGVRCDELCRMRVKDLEYRRGVAYLKIRGKGGGIRFVEAEAATLERIHDYLEALGHKDDLEGALFRPVKNNRTGKLDRRLDGSGVWRVLKAYAAEAGIEARSFCPHALRSTAATNALDNGADLARVQKWLGHKNIATTRLYDRRRSKPEDSPTYRVSYRK